MFQRKKIAFSGLINCEFLEMTAADFLVAFSFTLLAHPFSVLQDRLYIFSGIYL
jgi:hypothetical protein